MINISKSEAWLARRATPAWTIIAVHPDGGPPESAGGVAIGGVEQVKGPGQGHGDTGTEEPRRRTRQPVESAESREHVEAAEQDEAPTKYLIYSPRE